jgi:hypothetical protein
MNFEEKSVIVRFHSNFSNYSQNIDKYLNFINQVYSSKPDVATYLESVMGIDHPSLIGIYKNFTTFQNIQIAVSSEIKEFAKQLSQKETNFLLENIEHGESFPPEGLILKIEMVTNPASDLFPYFRRFYESMHSDIHVFLINNKNIEIKMITFEAFKTYTYILFAITKLTQ